MNQQSWETEFEKTMLMTHAGQWLEDSLYEETVNDMKFFIKTALAKQKEEMVKEMKRYHPTHLGESGGICMSCTLIDVVKK